MQPYSLRNRVMELSTWLGFLLVGVAIYFGYKLDPSDPAHFVMPLIAAIGGLGVAVPDRGTTADLASLVKLLAGPNPTPAAVTGALLKVLGDGAATLLRPVPPPAPDAPATAVFGNPTLTPKSSQAGFALREALGLLCAIAMVAIVTLALSGCQTPQQKLVTDCGEFRAALAAFNAKVAAGEISPEAVKTVQGNLDVEVSEAVCH